MIRGHIGLKRLMATVVAASMFLAGFLATGNSASAEPSFTFTRLNFTVESIAIVSEPENGDTYRVGEVIDAEMDSSTWIAMESGSSIRLRVGTNTRHAFLNEEVRTESFEGSFTDSNFIFSYEVQPDDYDADGVVIQSGPFEGAYAFYVFEPIRFIGPLLCSRLTENEVQYTELPGAFSVLGGHKVDGRPWVDKVEVVSSPASDNAYQIGESIDVDLTFNQPVDVVDENIAASLWFGETNGGEGSVWRGAYYESGSGTDTLRFSYQVQPGDYDANSLHVGAKGATSLGAGRIKAAGTDIDAVHTFAGVNTSQRVDGLVLVDGMEVISSPKAAGVYRAGETFEIAMIFNRPVEVQGEVRLSMRVGSDDPASGFARPPTAGPMAVTLSASATPSKPETWTMTGLPCSARGMATTGYATASAVVAPSRLREPISASRRLNSAASPTWRGTGSTAIPIVRMSAGYDFQIASNVHVRRVAPPNKGGLLDPKLAVWGIVALGASCPSARFAGAASLPTFPVRR